MALWSGCLAMRRSRCEPTLAPTTNQTRTILWEVGGYLGRDLGDGVDHGPQLPVGAGPAGGVAPVVVHVVVSPGVG